MNLVELMAPFAGLVARGNSRFLAGEVSGIPPLRKERARMGHPRFIGGPPARGEFSYPRLAPKERARIWGTRSRIGSCTLRRWLATLPEPKELGN